MAAVATNDGTPLSYETQIHLPQLLYNQE
jgi:hypothetical protein